MKMSNKIYHAVEQYRQQLCEQNKVGHIFARYCLSGKSNIFLTLCLIYALNLIISFSRAIRHETLYRRIWLHHGQNLPSRQSSGNLVGNSGSSRISARLRRAEIAMGRCDSSRLFGNGPGQFRRDFSSEVRCTSLHTFYILEKKKENAKLLSTISFGRAKCMHVAYFQVFGIAREKRQKGATGRVARGKQGRSLLFPGWAHGVRPRRPEKGKRNRGSRFPRNFREGIGWSGNNLTCKHVRSIRHCVKIK